MGFDYCGIAKAKELTEDARRLEQWLEKGYHGEMAYMENHFDLRTDPRKLVPGAKSVITFLKNYYPDSDAIALGNLQDAKIAKYAYGEDYHEVIRQQLFEFLDTMRAMIGPIEGRGFVDSAPVLERSWAQLSGAGWIGKNGNLIRHKAGSFFFIATLIIDLELIYDDPLPKDYCGGCTKCIEACPTQAILPDKTIEAKHCISYFTIELKKEMIETDKQFNDWAFGCDICQDVCPWNKRVDRLSDNHKSLDLNFKDKNQIKITNFFLKRDVNTIAQEINSQSVSAFKRFFEKTSFERSGKRGIYKNFLLYLK